MTQNQYVLASHFLQYYYFLDWQLYFALLYLLGKLTLKCIE
jgi:hypothetical protein